MSAIQSPEIAELQNLNATIGRLQAEIKAKQSVVKELKEQVTITEAESLASIAACRSRTEARMQEIRDLLIPLEGKQHQIAEADAAIAKRKQLLQDETAALKSARHEQLSALQAQVIQQTQRLSEAHRAIATCKETVAGI